jgi:hypothetical protein
MANDKSKTPDGVIVFYSDDIEVNLAKEKYSLVRNQNLYELSILDDIKLDSIERMKNVHILFYENGHQQEAKGNYLYSSKIPEECNYFFAIGNDDEIVFKGNNIIQIHFISPLSK